MRAIGSTALTTSRIVNSDGNFTRATPPPTPRFDCKMPAPHKPWITFDR
jgi:hypothetical protein